jgi:hypothetical protein
MKNKIIWPFIALGSFFLVIGILFSAFKLPYNEIISTICFASAVTFYTATIIERLLLNEFTKRATEKVDELFRKYGEDAQKAIRQHLNTTFELVRNAEYNGVIGVLPPRRDRYINPEVNKNQNDFTVSRIKSSLVKTKSVKIFCISGREFLSETIEGEFYDVFLQKAKGTEQYNIQIMLADTKGYGSEIRGKRENPDDPVYIQRDVENALRGKARLEKTWKEKGSQPQWSIAIKFYNFIPQAWFVITDEEIFIESYHMAGNGFKSKFPNNFTDNDPCVGGRVPIFIAKKGSTLYEAMSDYFDWTWQHDDQNVFNQNFQDKFYVRDNACNDN